MSHYTPGGPSQTTGQAPSNSPTAGAAAVGVSAGLAGVVGVAVAVLGL